MRAILIDPVLKTVTEIQIGNNFEEINTTIDGGTFACPVTYDNNDSLYCDDEGLFKPQKGGVIMTGWDYPILGKMLILGCNPKTGSSVNAKSSLKFFTDQITWLTEKEVKTYQNRF